MLKSTLKHLWDDKFARYLIIGLIILGLFLIFQGEPVQEIQEDAYTINFFYSPTCPHCAAQKPFNAVLEEKYPDITIIAHDITRKSGSELFQKFADKYNITNRGVPATFFNGQAFIGFDTAETTGVRIEEAIKACLAGACPVPEKQTHETLVLPILGEIRIADYSLPMLAVVLGLIDGFNPCAMWALVFLIGLIMGLGDRKKMWLLVGSFVFASGVLYFLFMTAWLNVFLLVGYMRPLTIIIGCVALGTGILELRTYIKMRGVLVCPVMDSPHKGKLMEKMRAIVESPLTWLTFFGIIALAFMVNAIEFVCSSVIPVVFTETLALHHLSNLQYYGYILLYDFFFMLDDLVIFSLAAFTVTHVGDKYAKYCKLVGGLLLFVLGIILLFFPHLLR